MKKIFRFFSLKMKGKACLEVLKETKVRGNSGPFLHLEGKEGYYCWEVVATREKIDSDLVEEWGKLEVKLQEAEIWRIMFYADSQIISQSDNTNLIKRAGVVQQSRGGHS